MSDDDKKKVNIEDLPVPLKDLDKEEQENVTGGVTGITNPNPTPVINPTPNPSPINPRNPDPLNPTFNR
jgi:hypothetical protein